MKKDFFLIRGQGNEDYGQFRERILILASALLNANELAQIKVSYTEYPPPKIAVIPFKKKKIAAFSVFSPEKGNFGVLMNAPGFLGGYVVEEAVPVAYEKTWADGVNTPGVCLLTLFRKKKGIDYNTFIHRWHNGHTPLSLKIHPLWNYNRNVVKEKLTDSTYDWDGIVEEHFRTSSNLLNPLKFFGNPLIMVYNMLRVYIDTKSFLDYKTIETYLATEIWLKS